MPQTPVDLWTIALDTPRPLTLSEEEQARADRFHFERDRLHWARARSALRTTLARYLNMKPLEVRFQYGEYGKPTVEGSNHFSLSHSGGWAMIAVTRDMPVGIDLERIRDDVEIAKLLHRIGEEAIVGSTTADLFEAWTRREAKTKAMGLPLMEIHAADFRLVSLRAPQGFAASLALIGSDPVVSYCEEV